jgi:catechol-2,3-dioxygenase
LKAVGKSLAAYGIKAAGPTDHGFAQAISFRDPDGNFVSIYEYGPDFW